MFILGLNCYGHEAAACLLNDGVLVAMAEEERFNREKFTSAYPYHAIQFCLEYAKITIDDVDQVAFYVRPLVWLGTQVKSGLRYLPKSLNLLRGGDSAHSMSSLASGILHFRRLLCQKHGAKNPHFTLHYVEHHLAHCASAFYVSEFPRAAVLSIDAWGDRSTTMIARGDGNTISPLMDVRFPHSLGGLYSAVTEYLGFRANSDEYKVMGLSAFGSPEYYGFFRDMVRFKPDGTFTLDMKYLSYQTHGPRQWFSPEMVAALGPSRKRNEPMKERHKNIAASVQMVLEESVVRLARKAFELTESGNLCYAGGVAFNCVANRRLLRETPFKNLFIQPVAGDSGTSLGAALHVHYALHPGAPRSFVWPHSYWGPSFSDDACKQALEAGGVKFERRDDIVRYAARRIADGGIIGWFQGRMEVGPRALGNRSLLADPRRLDIKDLLNERVKKRESFRPFAPSILDERAHEYFDLDGKSPYMIMVADVFARKREIIPAVTHVDGTARVHTVNREVNPLYWDLIHEFADLTGVPILLNTSFNENEPIVCTPTEAVNCFKRTRIDTLVLGKYVVERSQQDFAESL